MLARRASWYGGLALALQQVDPSRPPQRGGEVFIDPVADVLPPPGTPIPGPDLRAHGNKYAFGMKALTDPAARDLSGITPLTVPSGLPVR